MARDPIPTWFFAVVLVRRGDQFLLVHERKHGQRWYLPAGRAEPGESLFDADLSTLPLRGPDVTAYVHYLTAGGQTYPLTVLAAEDAPPR